ncbi:conjugal transfer protein [Metallosphaera hakonensis]|uniref:conjugal transfer protein n=1 Tax=Metallosphaera hakonensis TaxID=79601 RepID=UPI000A54865D|nr:conjugal transfer protein [Metallosphaera hakonensis]
MKKIKNSREPLYPDLRAQEEMKIFHIARSFETLGKAYLTSYGFLIIFPSLIISTAKKGGLRAPRHLQKELNSLSILARQALNPKKLTNKLKHDPLGKSQLPDLFISSAKFMEQIGEKELATLYNKVSAYLSKPNNQRKYDDISQLRKEITDLIRFKEIYKELFEILKNCIEENSNEAICKTLTDETKKTLSSFINKTYLLDQIFSLLDLGLQGLYDGILYTAYLARAAEIADYTVGRTEEDEKYLAEIIDHQAEMFELLKRIEETNNQLIKDHELDDFMGQIEEESREFFKKIRRK